jgi:hypothetical protein
MSALMNKPTSDTNPLFNEVLYSARYLVNTAGCKPVPAQIAFTIPITPRRSKKPPTQTV